MTFALNLIAGNGAELEWSRTLMMAWLVIALTLSIIEVFWLTSGRPMSRAEYASDTRMNLKGC
jgi:hypothetical protein